MADIDLNPSSDYSKNTEFCEILVNPKFEPPAKILTNDDFTNVCTILKEVGLVPFLIKEKRTNELNELLAKLEEFCRKTLVDLTRSKDKNKKDQILEFLLKMDEEIPYAILARVGGFEIFGILFNLTYYDENVLYSVSNGVFEIYDNKKICWKLTEIKLLDSQINFVSNNLLLKQLKHSDKFQVFVCLG